MFTWFAATKVGQFFAGKMAMILAILAIMAMIGFAYWFIDDRATDRANTKHLLDQQAQEISNLKEDIRLSKEADAITATALLTLQAGQLKVDENAKIRAAGLDARLKQIAQGNGTPEQKKIETSRAFAEALRENFCTIKPEKCPPVPTPVKVPPK